MGETQVYDGQEVEGFERLDDDHPALKALRSERTLNKELRTTLGLQKIVAQYPNLGLTAEDFEGLSTVEQFEARAARLATLAGSGKPAVEPPNPDEPEPAQEPAVELSDAEKAFARMGNPLSATPPTGAKRLSVQEAQALYKKDRAEFEKARAAGLIDLGVTMTDRGGSLVFE